MQFRGEVVRCSWCASRRCRAFDATFMHKPLQKAPPRVREHRRGLQGLVDNRG
jgi:hypothetical protein